MSPSTATTTSTKAHVPDHERRPADGPADRRGAHVPDRQRHDVRHLRRRRGRPVRRGDVRRGLSRDEDRLRHGHALHRHLLAAPDHAKPARRSPRMAWWHPVRRLRTTRSSTPSLSRTKSSGRCAPRSSRWPSPRPPSRCRSRRSRRPRPRPPSLRPPTPLRRRHLRRLRRLPCRLLRRPRPRGVRWTSRRSRSSGRAASSRRPSTSSLCATSARPPVRPTRPTRTAWSSASGRRRSTASSRATASTTRRRASPTRRATRRCSVRAGTRRPSCPTSRASRRARRNPSSPRRDTRAATGRCSSASATRASACVCALRGPRQVHTSALLEMDFLGNQPSGVSQSSYFTSPTMRIRHAVFRVETPVVDFMVGQYWHLFGWMDGYFPNTTEIQGMPGRALCARPAGAHLEDHQGVRGHARHRDRGGAAAVAVGGARGRRRPPAAHRPLDGDAHGGRDGHVDRARRRSP